MLVIQREDESPISISSAKTMIGGVLPYERGVDIYMSVNAGGEVDVEGAIELRDEGSNLYEAFLAEVVKDACAQGVITPRFKYRPTLNSYSGEGDQDSHFTISHTDFVALCGLYGIQVEVIAASESVQEAQIQEETERESVRRLNRLRAEFGGSAKWNTKKGDWTFTGITQLEEVEKLEGRKRSDQKTIRLDLKEAANKEREDKRAGSIFAGL